MTTETKSLPSMGSGMTRDERARVRAAQIKDAARLLRADGYDARADTLMCQVVIKDNLSLDVWNRLQEMYCVCIITNP